MAGGATGELGSADICHKGPPASGEAIEGKMGVIGTPVTRINRVPYALDIHTELQ
jgi:hypothetical protein